MKFPGEAAERVARALLQAGSSTASDLAETLGLTTTGVRRHLNALVDAGLVVGHERAPYGPTPKRGRGRPGVVFSLTPEGRAACDQAYDDLALSALRFMSQEYGPDAVHAFASDRADQLAAAIGPRLHGHASPTDVAAALTRAGYAAQIEPLGAVAVQLCQHNCPVVDAAREFPILCEAETEALSRVMGRHVTRLATLAHGDEVCTAVIPNESNHAAAPGGAFGKVSA
ncbi:MAG: helix-turn-helix domain-containing protein [Actinomycetes bacterium]